MLIRPGLFVYSVMCRRRNIRKKNKSVMCSVVVCLLHTVPAYLLHQQQAVKRPSAFTERMRPIFRFLTFLGSLLFMTH